MTETSNPRHLLVIGAQCRSQPHLPLLDQAARNLQAAFLDPSMGACEPGLPDQTALHCGNLTKAKIEAVVLQATRHASRRGAILVLALLGHGFIPGLAPELHFMGWDSDHERDTAVNVPKLLAEAADKSGINGVIGVIDTCAAASGVPPVHSLLMGNRNGRLRMALLMAAGANQDAHEFRLARELERFMKSGTPGPDEYLSLDKVHHTLQRRILGQALTKIDYDGDTASGLPGLWLTRNRANPPMPESSVIGKVGRRRLQAALEAINPTPSIGAEYGRHDLTKLLGEVQALGHAEEHKFAIYIINVLITVAQTVEFLRIQMRWSLDEDRIRKATAALETMGTPVAPLREQYPVSDVDYIEDAVFHQRKTTVSPRLVLAHAVVALAREAQFNLKDPHLMQWAASIDAVTEVNQAIVVATASEHGRHLVLVVKLDKSPPGTWPDGITAWLVNSAMQHIADPVVLTCEPRQRSVELAVTKAIEWAERQAAKIGMPMRRVEIAVPERLMAKWSVDRIEHFGAPLIADFEVVLRWSELLESNSKSQIRRHAELLKRVDGMASVNWLSTEDTEQLEQLRERLVREELTPAVGLSEPPQTDELLRLLLTYAPIVIWPRDQTESPHQDLTLGNLRGIPAAGGRLPTPDRPATSSTLSNLRAVWDDSDWLDFCRGFIGPDKEDS